MKIIIINNNTVMPFMKVKMQRETTGGMVDTLTGRQDE